MKKTIAALLVVLSLSACGDSHNGMVCRQSVVDEIGTQDVVPLRYKYTFVAKDSDNNVWYVETLNQTDAEVSKKVLLFKAVK